MYILPLEKRKAIIAQLVEGSSMRATARLTDTSIMTVMKVLVETGKACIKFHNENIVNVKSQRIQCDETWAFVGCKQKNVKDDSREGSGDAWTWLGLDADSKLVISWFVGGRDADSAQIFMKDVASRLANRVQLTTDGHKAYLDAVEDAFDGEVDFGQLIKIYGAPSGENNTERKYSPTEYTGQIKKAITGQPKEKFISTSYVERLNLTLRMHNRRFTRLTNAFSKKLENHCYSVALHFTFYNWCRIHKTLSVTPAIQAGLTKRLMTIEDIARLTHDTYKAPEKRGSYKKNRSEEE